MATSKRNAAKATAADPWTLVTWDDLTAWAGERSVERGRRYQRSRHVADLARGAGGRLLAWVRGTQRYATRVELIHPEAGVAQPVSRCTCPVGADGCKHAVAVVLEYLEALKAGTAVPVASDADPRWRLIDAADEDGDDWDDEPFEGEEGFEDEEPASASRPTPPPKSRSKKGEALRSYLESRSGPELVEYVMELAGRFPEVRDELAERSDRASGDVHRLIKQARREITRLTAQESWYNPWNGEGTLPDYDGLKRRFRDLLELGQADALLELGEELLAQGTEQVGSSGDEGETASAISACLDIVFEAVPRSSRSAAGKLLYAIGMELRDEYDLCAGSGAAFDSAAGADDWSEVADALADRLRGMPSSGRSDFGADYQRDRLTDRLIHALEAAGRSGEVLPLCEQEARRTGNYGRLVARLIEQDRLDDAERWAEEGIERVGRQWPGIAGRLRGALRDIAVRRQDWPRVAARDAEAFFEEPGLHSFRTLCASAAKAGCEDEVRAAALRFLETGTRPAASSQPQRRGRSRASKTLPPGWPLPESPAPRPERGSAPHFDVLLELALAENRPDDALHWFDRLGRGRSRSPYGGYADEYATRVADAVAERHPERSLDVYRRQIDSLIARTSPSAYESARTPLKKMHAILTRLGREAEWDVYLAGLRETHRRKRRLLDVLDRLDGRPIVEE